MSTKRKKYDPSRRHKFDFEKGEYVEKEEYVRAMENPTAILYARVSDQKQVDEGDGINSQLDSARRWAERNNVTVIKEFTDKAITWARLDRKWLLDALDYLKKENYKYPKVTHFICSEISRISRSEETDDTQVMKKKIEATGVSIILSFSWRNITTKNLNETFITDIDIVRAKHERLQIRERSLNGSISKLYNGVWIFYPPVWYERKHIKNGNRVEKILEMKEPEASIIKEWLELFANGVITSNTQLLHYFNSKTLTSNFHTPNPWKLQLTFVQRLFELEKLYFYAWYILYPNQNYGITKPIEAKHVPLITLQTAHKILKRIGYKGWLKAGIRKDTSDLYPLRGNVYCPYCNHSMTGRPSPGKSKKLYYYYGCNRKDCRQKENINVNVMHDDFVKLLEKLTPKEGILNLVEWVLKEVFHEKEKIKGSINEAKKRRIKEIIIELESYPATIGKLSKPEIIARFEEKWSELEEEKGLLEDEIKNEWLGEKDFNILYERVRNIIIDPVSIRELGTTELKILLVGVLFWWKLYYKKNEGFQTPQISALYRMISHLSGGEITSGAPEDIFIKLYENLYTELKQKQDIIESFVAHIKYEAKFDDKIKTKLLPQYSYLEEFQTFNI